MVTFGNPQALCPICEKLLDRHTTAKDMRPPADRDLTVCAYCAALLRWQGDVLISVTEEEWQALPSECRMDVCRIQYYLGVMHGFRARRAGSMPS